MELKEHWEDVYQKKAPHEVTWYQPDLRNSLELIREAQLNSGKPIIDVGAGASTLVDHLLNQAHTDVTAFDLSETALDAAKMRLGDRAEQVHWICDDITSYEFAKKYALWHDCAVFHFLVDEKDRELYLDNLKKTLMVKGYLVISTFAEDGPEKCSGLKIVRYSKDAMCEILGFDFKLLKFIKETHISPTGLEQKFNYWLFLFEPE